VTQDVAVEEGLIVGDRLPVFEDDSQRLPLNVAVAQPVEDKDDDAVTHNETLAHEETLDVWRGDKVTVSLTLHV
jgi:hypothetical protein